jgi:squalene-associated FAD-dependent desaturase
MRQASKSVVIIGGGVAGIAAAVALSEAGFRVQLFEKRPLLGGRASSFLDKATGARIDECQHGTMRCCTNLADLLTRLGVHDQIQYFDAIEFLDRNGKRSAIRGSSLPAPLHTSFSFLTFKSLNLRDKVGIARAMLAMLHTKPNPKQDDLDVAAWFRRMGQTEQAVKRFWRPVLVSACNDELERISCLHAFKIFRDGFLLHPEAFRFGVPRVPLATLYTEPTLAYLQQRGGCIRTKTIVDEIHFERNRVTGVSLMDGERIEADYYVSALQFDLLLKLLPPTVTEGVPYWENLRKLELAPLCGIHLWFDRPIDCPPALAILDRDTEWIFNKTQNFGLPANEETYLSVVISASRRFAETPKEELLAHILEEVRECLPDARQANLLRSHVVRWPKATFSPLPGVETLRPDQRSPIENLYVAGEWTQTGWPSTMESAARSGYRAAEYLLEREGRPQTLVAPDLPRNGIARLF